MTENTNLEVLRVKNDKDVEENFFFNSENGSFEFADKDYTGAVEITSSGAKALGENWTRMFADTKVSKVIVKNALNATNMEEMFSESKATSIDLSNFDTSNVTNMRGMFQESRATKIDLSKFDTSNVIDMSYMFYRSKVESLDLSNFNTSNVKDMSGMFTYSIINTLDLRSFNTSSVVYMQDMFRECRATSIDLSSFDTSNVVDMKYMFSLSWAGSLDLSSFDTSNVKDMRGMFWGSFARSINLSSFDTSNVKDMSFMFCELTATSLDLSSFDTSNVKDMEAMFRDSCIEKIFVKTENDANRIQANTNKILNLTVRKPEKLGIENLTIISENMLDVETIKKLIKIVLKYTDQDINLDDKMKILEFLYRMKNAQQQKM